MFIMPKGPSAVPKNVHTCVEMWWNLRLSIRNCGLRSASLELWQPKTVCIKFPPCQKCRTKIPLSDCTKNHTKWWSICWWASIKVLLKTYLPQTHFRPNLHFISPYFLWCDWVHILLLFWGFLMHCSASTMVADKGKCTATPENIPLGETCCSLRNDANSKTHTKIQNKYSNGNVLQMKKTCCRKPKQIH